ncbi:MAG: DUF4926 domain-containing protein [Armatimonadetes bacterium]|nr:DUF4926 domain-containing protein [Armatimonadota bacterium]
MSKGHRIKELDRVVLTKALPEHGLVAGDVGTVVLIHRGSAGYEVEFVALDGETVAVATVSASQVRSILPKELSHARSYVGASG